jgi:hypothetical protein
MARETMKTTRIAAEIDVELASFESQFQPAIIAAGTPDRKRLRNAARDAAHGQACRPENVARRLALIAEREAARRREASRRSAAARAADPVEQLRQWTFRWLRRIGLTRETRTGSGSAYYSVGSCRVRVSDHDVPMTDERQHNVDHGGFSWATHGWTIRINEQTSRMDVARDLVQIRKDARRQQ